MSNYHYGPPKYVDWQPVEIRNGPDEDLDELERNHPYASGGTVAEVNGRTYEKQFEFHNLSNSGKSGTGHPIWRGMD